MLPPMGLLSKLHNAGQIFRDVLFSTLGFEGKETLTEFKLEEEENRTVIMFYDYVTMVIRVSSKMGRCCLLWGIHGLYYIIMDIFIFDPR